MLFKSGVLKKKHHLHTYNDTDSECNCKILIVPVHKHYKSYDLCVECLKLRLLVKFSVMANHHQWGTNRSIMSLGGTVSF